MTIGFPGGSDNIWHTGAIDQGSITEGEFAIAVINTIHRFTEFLAQWIVLDKQVLLSIGIPGVKCCDMNLKNAAMIPFLLKEKFAQLKNLLAIIGNWQGCAQSR